MSARDVFIDPQAIHLLEIWAYVKRIEDKKRFHDPELDFPETSKPFISGNSNEVDEMSDFADVRTFVITEEILWDMKTTGLQREELAIFNRFYGDVWRMRGNQTEILESACREYLKRAKNKGLC